MTHALVPERVDLGADVVRTLRRFAHLRLQPVNVLIVLLQRRANGVLSTSQPRPYQTRYACTRTQRVM